MRRLFVALLTALTVVIGLSELVGTASAATPLKAAEGDSCVLSVGVAGVIKAGVCAAIEVTTPPTSTPTPVPTAHPCGPGTHWDPRDNRCEDNRGGPVYGGGHGTWNDRLDGRYFRLDRGPALDICDSGASTYDLWLNRNGSYRDRIVRQLNAQRWNDLRRADCGVIVSNNGDCVTYVTARDSIRNWNNDYNRLRGVYNGDFNRLNATDRDNLRRLWDNASRYRGQWDSSLSRLRTVCQDTTPTVTIIQAPPVVLQAPAPVAAPAPVYSAPAPSGVSGGSIPQGSVNTGGWSAAFVLAHTRAV
jgi:hypothetical protein